MAIIYKTLLILFFLFFATRAYCNNSTDISALNENPNIQKYMQNLEENIKKNWKPKIGGQKNTTATFTINKKGELLSNRIVKSDSTEDASEAAKAIENASPFGTFPKEIKSKTITIEMNFVTIEK